MFHEQKFYISTTVTFRGYKTTDPGVMQDYSFDKPMRANEKNFNFDWFPLLLPLSAPKFCSLDSFSNPSKSPLHELHIYTQNKTNIVILKN